MEEEFIVQIIIDYIEREARGEISTVDPEMNEYLRIYGIMYNNALNDYNKNKSKENEEKLKLLTKPINLLKEYFEYYEEEAILPSVAETVKEIPEKEKAKIRKLDKASNFMTKVNGFAMAVFVLLISSAVGFALGILLFKFKR